MKSAQRALEEMRQANPVARQEPPGTSADEMLDRVSRSKRRYQVAPTSGLRRALPATGLAVVVIAALTLGVLVLQLRQSASPVADSSSGSIGVVVRMFDAWNEGDLSTYLATQSDEYLAASARGSLELAGIDAETFTADDLEQLIVDDFWYWFHIDTDWTVSSCQESRPSVGAGLVVSCQIIADTIFDRISDELDTPTPIRVTVIDGLITVGSTDFIGFGRHFLAGPGAYQRAAAEFDAWVRAGIESETFEASSVPCRLGRIYPPQRFGIPPTIECSEWMAQHIPEWQAGTENTDLP